MIDRSAILFDSPVDASEICRVRNIARTKEIERRDSLTTHQAINVPGKSAADRDRPCLKQQAAPQCHETAHAGAVTTYGLVALRLKVLAQPRDQLEKICSIFVASICKMIAMGIGQDHAIDFRTGDELHEQPRGYHE